jgi:hypothetical protein
MTTAFVLSGGGSLGSVQVGMLLALADRGITPDLVIGTSVGALNAAWIAGRPGLEGTQQLAKVWSAVGRGDIFPTRPWTGALGLLGRANHTVPSSPLRSLLHQHLNYALLEDAPIPVRLVATEVTTGQEVVLAHGDAVDAVSASAALPGVFPPVRIDGRFEHSICTEPHAHRGRRNPNWIDVSGDTRGSQLGDSTLCLSRPSRLRKSGLATIGNSSGTIIALRPFMAGKTMWNVTCVPPATGSRSKMLTNAPLSSVALKANRVIGTTSVISTSLAWLPSLGGTQPTER